MCISFKDVSAFHKGKGGESWEKTKGFGKAFSRLRSLFLSLGTMVKARRGFQN